MKGVVMLPTYQESGNIARLLDALLAQPLDLRVLVVDDDSPDGTGDIVREKAKLDSRILLLTRRGPRGRGYAGAEGLRAAAAMPVDYVIEMDADFSHPPEFLPQFMPALEKADVVIASRLVPGGGEQGRGWGRMLLTALACGWIRLCLRVPVRDGTTGFRCYRSEALRKLDWAAMTSSGPSILQEVLWSLHKGGARMLEIPFIFQPRAAGHSQLNIRKLFKSLRLVTSLGFQKPRLLA